MTIYLLSASRLCSFSSCGWYLYHRAIDPITFLCAGQHWWLHADEQEAADTLDVLARYVYVRELEMNAQKLRDCHLKKWPETQCLRSTSYHEKAAKALCGSFLVFKVHIQFEFASPCSPKAASGKGGSDAGPDCGVSSGTPGFSWSSRFSDAQSVFSLHGGGLSGPLLRPVSCLHRKITACIPGF